MNLNFLSERHMRRKSSFEAKEICKFVQIVNAFNMINKRNKIVIKRKRKTNKQVLDYLQTFLCSLIHHK